MKKIFKKILLLRWLLTLPVALFFVVWLNNTATQYSDFVLEYESQIPISLYSIGKNEFFNLLYQLRDDFSTTSIQDIAAEKSLAEINLFVPDSNMARLNSNLPHSGFEYVKGGLWVDGKVEPVKIRYRGDYGYHWMYEKKSFRIKTKKKNLFRGMRRINLIAPKRYEQINGYLSYKLAELMGLIVPKTEMVSVSINGDWKGLYQLVEQIDETTLRRNSLMPGDIYVGEMVGNDRYQGLGAEDNLFRFPSLWEKAAYNNHYPEEARKPLERLVYLIATIEKESSANELSQIMDMEAWGRFSAFESLSQSIHFDSIHNWRLYFDPARSKFLPIVWDPMGFNDYVDPDIVNSDLHYALFRNADFLRERENALLEFFESGLDEKLLDEYSRVVSRVKPYVLRDYKIMVSGGPSFPGNLDFGSGDRGISWPKYEFSHENPADVVAATEGLGRAVRSYFQELRRYFLMPDSTVKVAGSEQGEVLKVSFAGGAMVRKIVLNFTLPLSKSLACEIGYFKNNQLQKIDISDLIEVKGSEVTIPVQLAGNFRVEKRMRDNRSGYPKVFEPAYYEFYFDGIAPDNSIRDVLVARGLQELKGAELVDDIPPSQFATLQQIVPERSLPVPLRWSGEVVVSGQKTITRDLILEPGTVVRLEPDASLVLKGRVLAKGTSEQPILFTGVSGNGAPWGSVVLIGNGADHSRFTHCEFAGGSGYKGDLFEYSGMFSVHDVDDVTIDHCRFRDSFIVDDMVHAVYSSIHFIDSTFSRSKSDALDLDISEAVVENCRFENSGNDAVDLMTTDAVIVNTIFHASGDKGISVGEGSRLLAINNRFSENSIGLQSKDGSVATIYNAEFLNNKHALDAYKKNWRYYDGGKVFLYKAILSGNSKQVSADKNSKIKVFDSSFDQAVEQKNKRIFLDETIDFAQNGASRTAELWRFPEDVGFQSGFGAKYWDDARPQLRGTFDFER